MTEASDSKPESEQTRSAESPGRCYCEEAREVFSRFTRAFEPPEDVRNHFRQARIEVLKGMRELLDHRIERLSRMNRKGTRVTVE